MNCVELQQSLAEMEDSGTAAQQAHLETCPECSALVADLNLIAATAIDLREAEEPSPRVWKSIETELRQVVAELNQIAATAGDLRGAEEPSPRVWNSIEIALRQEGLIRPQRTSRSLLPSLSSRWVWARWMVPAAAALLIAVSVYVRQHSLPAQLAHDTAKVPAIAPVSDGAVAGLNVAGLNDDDLLQEVAALTPAAQAQYADNLRRVNEYIRDAKSNADAYPDDEEARRSLLDAYQEKAMLFELAMDHPLP